MSKHSRKTAYPILKDSLGPHAVQHIGACLKDIHPKFDEVGFAKTANRELAQLELKARVRHLISTLNEYLPANFQQTAKILSQVKHHQLAQQTPHIKAYTAWPLIDYLAVYGLQHPEIALATLAQLTSLFSAEFAIRPFIQQHYTLTYAHLQQWCDSPDHHLRRLVSEGTRPRLPWGAQLPAFINDPGPIFPLLEKLNNDNEAYVRRSVANNLNDISKDHPERVLQTCADWLNQPTPEKQWITRHATRSLIKQGNVQAFVLLGYAPSPRVDVELTISKPKIAVGEQQSFSLILTSKTKHAQKLVVDYAIHFIKKNGAHRAKVFKLKNVELAAGKSLSLTKNHSFEARSTRRYYPGEHLIEIRINGNSCSTSVFILSD